MRLLEFQHFIFLTDNEFCERLAYYGIARNLVTYLKVKLHLGNLEAARNVTTWQGTWGKYWTIAVFSSIYFIVSAKISPPNL